ncbi:TolC family protein [Cryomorpha ignava]|uniref:TolC family protein n=1 Tax=Cryomorpha ignava TaxID=101383 RepID=A0A7K3WL62_9FLAO|nr:TolC family protein [Cryomorpha ignava]NEN22268.1 TolC family protein [Cryomorpha ignava]
MKLVNAHILLSLVIIMMGYPSESTAQTWSLQQCIDKAIVQNRQLQIGRNNQAISQEQSKEARSNLIPKVTLNADYKYFTDLPYQIMPTSAFGGPEGQFKEIQFGVPHNIGANIQATVPLYNPKIVGSIKTAQLANELTDLQYQKTEEDVLFEISNLYYNAQIIHHQLLFIDSNLVNANSLLQKVALLNQQLLAQGSDVAKIQLQIAQLKTKKKAGESQYQQILNALKFYMGLPLDKDLKIEENINPQIIENYTLKKSIDIALVKAKNKLIKSELNTLQNTRLLPSLNAFGSYGTSGFGYTEKPNDFLNFYPIGFVGLQFSYPLFNGMVTKRQMNRKVLEIDNNQIQLNMLEAQNEMQLENAINQKMVAQEAIENTDSQVSLAKNIYEQTILQHREGTANLSDVLLADNELRSAQQDYLSAIIEYLKADLDLKKITGNFSQNK